MRCPAASGELVLQLMQAVVEALPGQELVVRTLLPDAAPVDHEDPVHELDGGEAMGHDDGRPILEEHSQRVLDE